MTITDFLRSNYQENLKDIAEHGCVSGLVSELIYFSDIDKFYEEHKEEIDNIAEEVFYSCYEGCPEEWFNNGKKLGFDLVNINDARRFYTWLAVEVTAQNIINQA